MREHRSCPMTVHHLRLHTLLHLCQSSYILRLGLSFRGSDMRIVYLLSQPRATFRLLGMGCTDFRCKFQACQGLVQMRLQRTDHHKHKCFRVTTQRELEQVGQLWFRQSTLDHTLSILSLLCYSGKERVHRLCPARGLRSHLQGS